MALVIPFLRALPFGWILLALLVAAAFAGVALLRDSKGREAPADARETQP